MKLCLFCTHFNWREMEGFMYSTLTGGGTSGGFECLYGYPINNNPWGTAELRKSLRQAESCEDYEVAL